MIVSKDTAHAIARALERVRRTVEACCAHPLGPSCLVEPMVPWGNQALWHLAMLRYPFGAQPVRAHHLPSTNQRAVRTGLGLGFFSPAKPDLRNAP